MKKETIEIRFINRLRVDIHDLKELGFKEVKKSPTHIRDDIEDDMRRLELKLWSDDQAKYSNESKQIIKSMGYTLSNEVLLGKKVIGFYRYVERNYIEYIWRD